MADMDIDAFFIRVNHRVAALEAAGKRIPAEIKKTIRQRPQHGYRLDIIERLAGALDWSVPELLAGVWSSAKFSQETIPYGLQRHAVCLVFARKWHVENPLAPPGENERQLENLVAQLYQDWRELERSSGKYIDAETITAVFERYYPLQPDPNIDRSSSDSRPSRDKPEDLPPPELKAAPDDASHPSLAA